MTKSAQKWGFGQIYEKLFNEKLYFLSGVKDNLEDLVALENEPNYKTKSLGQLS